MKRFAPILAAGMLVAATPSRAIQLTWTQDLAAPDDVVFQLNGVRAIDGDVYLAGYTNGTLAGYVWKRSGGVWTDLGFNLNGWLNTIDGTSSNDIWVGGSGGVFHYDGNSWTNIPAGVGQEIKRIDAIDANHVVVLGANGGIRQSANGGGSWTSILGGNGGTTHGGLLANAPSDIWIGGYDGQTYFEHWNGSSYDVTPGYTTPGSFVQAIAGLGDHTYACGTGGEAWKLDASGTNFVDIVYPWKAFAAARDVAVDTAGDAWFVGDRAHVFHYDMGTGVYDAQPANVHQNTSSLGYQSIDIFNNNRNLIVVGRGGVFDAELPAPPEPVLTEVALNDTIGFEFDSIFAIDYQLQYSTNGMATWSTENFTIHGLGQTEMVFDPSGFDSNKAYRVIVK